MHKPSIYVGRFANFIGGIGYINIVIQWVWSVIPLFYLAVKNPVLKNFVSSSTSTETAVVKSTVAPLSPNIELLLLILAILFSVSIITYVIATVPKGFGKTGKAITTKSADIVIPLVTQHKKITKKQYRSLSTRISWSIKLGIVLIPTLLLLVPVPRDLDLTQAQFAAAGIAFAIGTLLLFAVQLILSKVAKLPPEKVW